MPQQARKSKYSGIGCLSGIVLAVAIYGYFRADNMGWIPHHRTALVVAPSDGWPQSGESIRCVAVIPSLLGVSLNCGRGSLKSTAISDDEVTFWGIVGA